jgi:hypothetical protein
MTNPKTHYVLYVGDGVVPIPGVGVFQRGTGAWVDARTAEIARSQGEFQVTDPQGGVQQASAPDRVEPPPAPVEAAPPALPAPVEVAELALPAPAEAAELALPAHVEAAPAPVAEAAPPHKRPRRGRASAVMSAVVVEEEAVATPPETEPKK